MLTRVHIRGYKSMKDVSQEEEQAPEPNGVSTSPAVRERNLRYRVEVAILPKTGMLQIVDEYLAALNERGEPTGKRKPFLSREGNRLHLRLEGQAHPTYYERYLDHTVLSLPHYPPHYPHLVAMRRELESWLFFYFEPRERMRAVNPVKEVRHIGLMGEELAAFLNCRKTAEGTQIEPFRTWGPLERISSIEASLDDHVEGGLTVSERLLRGDFDA